MTQTREEIEKWVEAVEPDLELLPKMHPWVITEEYVKKALKYIRQLLKETEPKSDTRMIIEKGFYQPSSSPSMIPPTSRNKAGPKTVEADELCPIKEALRRTQNILLDERSKGVFGNDFVMCIERAINHYNTRSALPKETGWRPIETAPKDGTKFLALIGGIPYAAKYDEHDRFIWYMHSNKADGNTYRIHNIDGLKLKEQIKEAEYDYQPSALLWKRGFNDTASHWMPYRHFHNRQRESKG